MRANNPAPVPPHRYCPLPHFVDRFSSRDWPAYARLAQFCKAASPTVRLTRQAYETLQKARPVEYALAKAFVNFLRTTEEGWDDVTVNSAFQPYEATEALWPLPDSPSVINPTADALADRFSDDCQLMFLKSHDLATELESVASGISYMAGYKSATATESKDKDACAAKGLKQGGWDNEDDFISWLARMHRADRHTVMYAANKGRRVGACVLLPLSPQTNERLRSGDLQQPVLESDLQLTAPVKHLQLYVFDDFSHRISIDEQSAEIQVAHMHLMLWQIAYFTRGLEPYRPTILSVMRIKQHFGRLHGLGFGDIGQVVLGTRYPIYVLQHPDEWGNKKPPDTLHESYAHMVERLQWYQQWNRDRWKKEDRILTSDKQTVSGIDSKYKPVLECLRSVKSPFVDICARWWIMGRHIERYGDDLGARKHAKLLKKLHVEYRLIPIRLVCGEKQVPNVNARVAEFFGEFPNWQEGNKKAANVFYKAVPFHGRKTTVRTEKAWEAWRLIKFWLASDYAELSAKLDRI